MTRKELIPSVCTINIPLPLQRPDRPLNLRHIHISGLNSSKEMKFCGHILPPEYVTVFNLGDIQKFDCLC